MNGGGLGVFGGTLKVKQDQAELSATQVETGINTLLEKWGVKMRDDVVADAKCGQAPFRTPIGLQIPVAFPPVPIVSFDEQQSKHPVAYRLDQVFCPFGATLSENGALKSDKDVKTTVVGAHQQELVADRGRQHRPQAAPPARVGDVRQARDVPGRHRARGQAALGLQRRGRLQRPGRRRRAHVVRHAPTKPVHVFVVASSGFIRDEFLPPPERANAQDLNSAVAFGLNAVDWLAQEDELIAIRAKSVEEPLIEVPVDGQGGRGGDQERSQGGR